MADYSRLGDVRAALGLTDGDQERLAQLKADLADIDARIAEIGKKGSPLGELYINNLRAQKPAIEQEIREIEQRLRTSMDGVVGSMGEKAPAAGRAGESLGGSFRGGLMDELAQAPGDVARIMQQIVDAMNITASPTPRINAPGGMGPPGTPGSSAGGMQAAMHGLFADYGVSTV